jgi:hypothetical protein
MWKRLLNLAIILGSPVVVIVIVRGRHEHSVPHLDDDNPAGRIAAIRALNGPPPNELLHDEDPDVRLVAVSRLTNHADHLRALRDPHPGVRREAAWGLTQGGARACPFLREALQDKDPHVRAGAAQAILDMRHPKLFEPYSAVPSPRSEMPDLVRILIGLQNDSDPEVRRWVFKALKHW